MASSTVERDRQAPGLPGARGRRLRTEDQPLTWSTISAPIRSTWSLSRVCSKRNFRGRRHPNAERFRWRNIGDILRTVTEVLEYQLTVNTEVSCSDSECGCSREVYAVRRAAPA